MTYDKYVLLLYRFESRYENSMQPNYEPVLQYSPISIRPEYGMQERRDRLMTPLCQDFKPLINIRFSQPYFVWLASCVL